MNEQAAIDQIALLGHGSFSVFYNMGTASVNVTYRDHEGRCGLIMPEIG